MKTIRVEELSGRLLDCYTAFCLGWMWAKNIGEKTSTNGQKYLIPPQKAKRLHRNEPNSMGWIRAEPSDVLAEDALKDVPQFSQSWADLGEYIDNLGIGFIVNHGHRCPPHLKITAFHPSIAVGLQGPTHCIAACRSIVASTYGPEITDQTA